MTAGGRLLDPLDGKSQTLFLLAGAILVVYASLLSYQAFVDPSTNFHDNEAGVVGPLGFAVGALGLLGLTPALVDESRRVAQAGAVFAGLGVVGWFVIAATGLADLAGFTAPTALQILGFFGFFEMLVGFPLVGVASLRSDGHTRALGLLLVAPALLFGTMIASGAVTGGTAVGAVLISSGLTLVHLSVGYVLRTGPDLTSQPESAASTTAR